LELPEAVLAGTPEIWNFPSASVVAVGVLSLAVSLGAASETVAPSMGAEVTRSTTRPVTVPSGSIGSSLLALLTVVSHPGTRNEAVRKRARTLKDVRVQGVTRFVALIFGFVREQWRKVDVEKRMRYRNRPLRDGPFQTVLHERRNSASSGVPSYLADNQKLSG
jgi:hypothetical protein